MKKFIHKKDNYILSSGKTGLFYCHAEVQMYIADAYGNQVIREVDSCSYQRISFQLLVHLHSLHSGKGACAHTLFFFAASTTLKVEALCKKKEFFFLVMVFFLLLLSALLHGYIIMGEEHPAMLTPSCVPECAVCPRACVLQ